MNAFSLFDQSYYVEINKARWSISKNIIGRLPELKTCTDVGCGPGWFAEKLVQMGLTVFGVDGRLELVEEARRRVPHARFNIMDITSAEVTLSMTPTDLVFCFGLIYHLENPFSAIRNLHSITKKYLFIETQIAPGDNNNFVLVSEGKNATQGLNFHALVPSRRALVKMLYVSGFTSVYRFTGPIGHNDFIDEPNRIHRREIFLALKAIELNLPDFVLESEPLTPKIDYKK